MQQNSYPAIMKRRKVEFKKTQNNFHFNSMLLLFTHSYIWFPIALEGISMAKGFR